MEQRQKISRYTYPEDVFALNRSSCKQGELLLNPYTEMRIDVPKILAKYSHLTNRHSRLGKGVEGEVRAVDNYAVKRFYERNYTVLGSEEDLLANIAVTQALKKHPEPIQDYQVRGIEIYGALHTNEKHLWVMERLRPATATKLEEFSLNIPNCGERTRLVNFALNEIGITPLTVFIDDTPHTRNHVVTRKATTHDPGEIVLLDSRSQCCQ